MLQIAIDILGPPPAPPRIAPVPAPAGGFDLMLEQLKLADPDAQALPAPAPPLPLPGSLLPPERQEFAGGDGEEAELPQPAADEDEEAPEPIWLPPMFAPATPQVAPRLVTDAPARPISAGLSPTPAPQPAAQPTPDPAALDGRGAEPVKIERQPSAEFEIEPAPEDKTIPAEPRLSEAKVPPSAPPVTFQPAAIVLQPMAQVALAAQRVEQPARAEPTVEEPRQMTETMAGISAPSSGPARVEAASNAQDAPLDMSQGDWIESMIERIETLRESGERGAQIRLRPDALGTIDVRIRQEGEQVHISFATENPVARSLLTEAAPRLGDLAEARGLKLGETGVGQGFGGERREQPQLADSRTPNRAPRAATPTQIARSNERIA